LADALPAPAGVGAVGVGVVRFDEQRGAFLVPAAEEL
jgi:hypothetical protein